MDSLPNWPSVNDLPLKRQPSVKEGRFHFKEQFYVPIQDMPYLTNALNFSRKKVKLSV